MTAEERSALTEEALAGEQVSMEKDVAALLGMIGQEADRDSVVQVLQAAARRVAESSLGSAAKLQGLHGAQPSFVRLLPFGVRTRASSIRQRAPREVRGHLGPGRGEAEEGVARRPHLEHS